MTNRISVALIAFISVTAFSAFAGAQERRAPAPPMVQEFRAAEQRRAAEPEERRASDEGDEADSRDDETDNCLNVRDDQLCGTTDHL